MRKLLLFLPFILLSLLGILTIVVLRSNNSVTGAPPYHVTGDEAPNLGSLHERYSWLNSWKRPDGPPRVGLQVGHWKNDEIPEELHRLRGNTGASGGGRSEWEVNYEIAQLTKDILSEKGIIVDIIPATVPKTYWADVFVAIHADGNLDINKSGYKAASPRRDFSGKADLLTHFIETEYEKATGLLRDSEVTDNMRGYYAFSFWRFDHAIHPMTVASILETGFLTNPSDRLIIVDQPHLSAQGLSNGIISYLKSENLLTE